MPVARPRPTTRSRGPRPVRGHRGGESQPLRDRGRPRGSDGETGRVPGPVSDRIPRAPGEIRGAGDTHTHAESPGRDRWTTGGAGGLRDAWDTPLQVANWGPGGDISNYAVSSAGPDEQFDTGDDLQAYLQVRTDEERGTAAFAGDAAGYRHRTRSRSVQWTRGVDGSGEVRRRHGGDRSGGHAAGSRTAGCAPRSRTAAGQFTLCRVCLRANTRGSWPRRDSRRRSRKVALRARDRAVISSEVQTGQAVELVAVNVVKVRRWRRNGRRRRGRMPMRG